MRLNAICYDIEIEKGILGRGESRLEGIEYCAGWNDHANMGVSVIGCYDWLEDRYRVFCRDNFPAFLELADERRLHVTFNGLAFDDRVISNVVGVLPVGRDTYDLLVELWVGAGLPPQFKYPTHIGFGLDATSAANLGSAKSGEGALAPVQWQRGERGSVIDYCLNDVRLTKMLFERVVTTGGLRDPRNPKSWLGMRGMG